MNFNLHCHQSAFFTVAVALTVLEGDRVAKNDG